MTDYFEQLDKFLGPEEQNRFLSGADTGNAPSKDLVSIKQLGSTFAEKGRGNETVLQSLVSAIRQGRGQLQLAMQHDYRTPMGGGIASIGKSQRQAIKEMIKVSGVDWEGLEMPSGSFSNVTGRVQGGFDDQKRQEDLRHIKDAIQFSAEIGAGGNVDVWSQEFDRDISTAEFQDKDDAHFENFKGWDPDKHARRYLVDERTGRVMPLAASDIGGQGNSKISVPIWRRNEQGQYVDAEGNILDPDYDNKDFIMNRVPEWDEEKKKFESKQLSWTEFQEYAQQLNKESGADRTPEEWWQRIQLENAYSRERAQAIQFSMRYENEKDELNKLVEARDAIKRLEEGKSEDELVQEGLLVPQPGGGSTQGGQFLPNEWKKKSEIMEESITQLKRSMQQNHEISGQADARAESVWQNIEHVKPVEEYAKEKTWESYADLGLYALEQTEQHKPSKPIAVGPELGWPQAYGGHTEEFIEIVEGSREKMVEQMRQDSRFARKTDKELKELAKKHINGVLDTSHLSMWYNHFPEKQGESEEKRLKRFNNWYLKQMDKLADAGVVGSVQIVDSASGAHRHLPVGEGIFPTVDAVKRLREKGWDGAILSEGHEEEPANPGSTQYSLWNAFGASIGTGYHFGTPRGGNSFGNIYTGNGGAAGYRAPANYIVGGYSPSNEWKSWSEVPLE